MDYSYQFIRMNKRFFCLWSLSCRTIFFSSLSNSLQNVNNLWLPLLLWCVCLLFDVVSLRTCTQKMLSIKFTRMKYEFKFIKRIFNFREAERLNETKKKVVSRKCFTFISVAYLDNWHFYHQFHACNKLATKFSDLKSQNNHKWTVCQHECELDMFSFLWLPLDKTHLP